MLYRELQFHLAQEFYWWNPSKLPTPAEWVNVRKFRKGCSQQYLLAVKDPLAKSQ